MEGYATGEGVAPSSRWGGGATPKENFQKLTSICCNLRHSEIIFLKFSIAIFLRNVVSKS